MKYALLAAALALAGCGDDGMPHEVDAALHADAAPRPDAGDPCDYHEQDDSGNDTTAEATGTLSNEVRICGSIRAHAPDGGGVVDTDRYGVDIPADEPLLIRLVSTDGAELASMRVQVGSAQDPATSSTLRGVHAALAAKVHAGTIQVLVQAENGSTPAAEVAYEVRVSVDEPDTRCATVSGPASYVEASDGATNSANDVMTADWPTASDPGLALTTDPTDAPEASGPALTVSAGMNYAATGSLDLDAAGGTDAYLDRDTYVVAAGSETNELSVRIAWTYDDVTDLDAVLVPSDQLAPLIAVAAAGDHAAAEFQTTSVDPSTTYRLWVGAYGGSTVPMPYTITLCGATFTP